MDNNKFTTPINNSVPNTPKKKSARIYLVIALLALVRFAFAFIDNPIGKKNAIAGLDAYIEQQYPTQLKQFQKQDGVVPHRELKLFTEKAVAYAYYYAQPENGWVGFTIVADLEGNVIYDGYKEWYQKGGLVYDRFNTDYQELSSDLDKGLYSKGINSDVFSASDEFSVDRYLLHNEKYVNGPVLLSPILDPEEDYTMEQLAKEYGRIDVYIKSSKDSETAFKQFAQLTAEYMAQQNVSFSELRVFLRPDKMENIRNIHIVFTMDQLYGDDITTFIDENTKLYTQEQYDADKLIAQNDPNNWPYEYEMDVVIRLGQELF